MQVTAGAGRGGGAVGGLRRAAATAADRLAAALWRRSGRGDPIWTPGWPAYAQRVAYGLFAAWAMIVGLVAPGGPLSSHPLGGLDWVLAPVVLLTTLVGVVVAA